MASGIQVLGKQQTLDMFDAYDLGVWAIFQSKEPIVSGEGSEDLSAWLDRLLPAGSVSVYTLRLYDGIEPNNITKNSDYRYCFSFKLHSDYGMVGGSYINNSLQQRIEGLEKKLEDSNGEEDDLKSIIMGWLEKPEKLATVIGAVKNLLSKGAAVVEPAAAVNAIGSIPTTQQQSESTILENEATLDRLSKVLDRLEKKDKDILKHLEKLADIADQKPDTFNFLISNLGGL
jgi:hypothetical protein